MSNKLSLKLNKGNFSDLVSKIQDLTNIEDVIKLKIDRDNILMYSMLFNDVSVLALKSYNVPTSEYIENFDKDETFDFIITGGSKFVKSLKFFNSEDPIKLEITYKEGDDAMHIRTAQFISGKLKISCIGGEQYKIRNIDNSSLESRLDISKSKWGFKVPKDDFGNIKRLCSINSEDRVLNINVNSGKVTFSENSKWELEVDGISDDITTQLIFGKKYLSNVNANNSLINFSVFETFILVKDENSNLLLSFEQDFSADDE